MKPFSRQCHLHSPCLPSLSHPYPSCLYAFCCFLIPPFSPSFPPVPPFLPLLIHATSVPRYYALPIHPAPSCLSAFRPTPPLPSPLPRTPSGPAPDDDGHGRGSTAGSEHVSGVCGGLTRGGQGWGHAGEGEEWMGELRRAEEMKK